VIPKKMNRLNSGSMIPDLKYKKGKKEPTKANTHKSPKVLPCNFLPILNITKTYAMPINALGSRAANSFTPKIFMHIAWNHINSGGFSQKGKKLMVMDE
jgi:hypothetical protein